jgi:two-component system, NtrC family, sensor kinase
MKVLLGILFLVFSSFLVCHSQITSNDTVRLTELTPKGILLDKGWKFHLGDDSAWSKLNFNDKDWQSIDPSLDIRHIPQIKNATVFWLRLTLLVDSSFMDQPLGITLSQVGASEIYLNEHLLYKFGEVSGVSGRQQSHYLVNRPFTIKLGGKRIQTIIVRYSYNQKDFLIKWDYPNYCMRIVLNTVGLTFSKFQNDTRLALIYEMTKASLWLILCTISFGLYFSIRNQKEYFLVGIYSFCLFLSNLLGGLIVKELTNTNAYAYTYLVSRILLVVGFMTALNVACRLFNQSKNWYYYTLMLGGLFALISFFVFYDQAIFIYLTIFVLYSLEFMRRSLKAIRNKRPGAILLFLASAFVFFFVGLMILFLKLIYLRQAAFCAFLAEVSVPLCWSLFISGEFGRTGIALQNRVREVEQLSQKTIAQEQEKQLFLATQNETLEKKVFERTSQLNESLVNLKATQAQLIQSEKMASLGELTAGIAHEIQNPLNFVNNFSELNKELIDETSKENEVGNSNAVKGLLLTMKDNEEKIYHHGKRADAIVKGMLQHSKTSTGQKESIDLNRLVEEYLRISYQGFRTRDGSFNAKLETNFDQNISKVDVIPQDIGRVLINLYNNAFYAVTEKKKQQSEGYEPTVYVSTIMMNDRVEIKVKDNGNGVPKRILDKIFQPFFTTKPTGQGTGLGLSLSYDIIKAHGGQIKVDSEEGKFTEFTITLPA